MEERTCRWGILGAAEIARKNWKAIRSAPNCTLTAVASRDPQRCRQFVEACQAHTAYEQPPRVCDTYEALLASDDVDAVYLPLPTAVRKDWTIRAADAGKHVLVEKPAGVRAEDVREMLEACRKNHVQFMDGVMFMHSRRLAVMRQVLDDGQSVGEVKRITSHFSFRGSQEFFQGDIRTDSRLEPFGCLGDLGWYNIRFTLWAMNEQLPLAVCGHILSEHWRKDSPAPVPVNFSGELFYPNGVSAGFYCSFDAENQQWASVSGTKGALCVSDFVLPHYGSQLRFEVASPVFRITGCDFIMEEQTRRITVDEPSNAQEMTMFGDFAGLALSGKPNPYWGEIALKTQQVLDACVDSARSKGQVIGIGAHREKLDIPAKRGNMEL